jgi:hypothetical protein
MLSPDERETLARLKRELESLREERHEMMRRLNDVESLARRTRDQARQDTLEQIKPVSEKVSILIDMGATAARKATERKEILEELRRERISELGEKILEADLVLKTEAPIQASIDGAHRRKIAVWTLIVGLFAGFAALVAAVINSHSKH